MQYFTLERELPFRAEVVWAALTTPETYGLWFEGLVEVDPETVLRAQEDLTLTIRGSASGDKQRKLTFDVTALRKPTDEEGLLAFEGRLKPEGLVLGSIRLKPGLAHTQLTMTLEIAQGSVLLGLFDKPFGITLASRDRSLRTMLERGLDAFQKALEVQTRDPYRGIA